MLRHLGEYLDSHIKAIDPGFTIRIRGFWFRLNFRRYFEYLDTSIRQAHRLLSSVQRSREAARGQAGDLPPFLAARAAVLDGFLVEPRVQRFLREGLPDSRFRYPQMLAYDHWLRREASRQLSAFIDVCFEVDALRALARASERWSLSFPRFDDTAGTTLDVEAVFHPFVVDPVPNDLHLDGGRNFLFLTGPNMAGKTTFLKALGVAVYLAHIGMAVPARRLVLGDVDAVASSLHIEENLARGHSFFYSEVRRVKEIAEAIRSGRRLLGLFDEIFKGTNVKDALDGSRLVIEGLARSKTSIFVLSSHLVELEEPLGAIPRIVFSYFESEVCDGRPAFSYRLQRGVSRERLGMLILESEGVPALLERIADQRKAPHPPDGDAGLEGSR